MDIGYEKYEGMDDDVYEKRRKPLTPPPSKKPGKPSPVVRSVPEKALRLYQKKQYAQCAELLTPYVEDDRRNIRALKLLAFSLIRTGHLDQTKRLFQRVLEVDKNDIESLNALSYYELSQNNTEAAINHLLDAIYVDKTNLRLKDNLDKIRDMKDPKIFLSMTDPDSYLFLTLPKPDLGEIVADGFSAFFHNRNAQYVLLALLILFTVAMVWIFWPAISNGLEQVSMHRMGLNLGNRHSIAEIDRLVSERPQYKIHMTSPEYQQKFLAVRQNLQEGKRNLAQIMINELLNSDAPEMVKEQTVILQEFVPDPVIDNLDYVPPFADVLKTPHRYKGVYVKWNGTISGIIHTGRDETQFNLLINVNDPSIVEGTAQVYFEGNLRVLNGEKVTVFGEVAGIQLDDQVILKGKSIIRLR